MDDWDSETGEVATDFKNALQRLKDNAPTAPELVARLANGRLRINVATVALEAGHARRLIGLKKCPYPKIRAAVLRAVTGDPEKRKETLKEEIFRLRNANSELRDMVDLVVTANAELVIRVRNAEKGAYGDGRPIKRASKSARLSAISIVGKKSPAASSDK